MNDKITLDHGSGGKASHDLINQLFVATFGGQAPACLEDAALLPFKDGQIAFSTDSFVVDPIFFAGGNIGDLAVNGTVNDLAMRGARPLYLSVAMILEEGFPLADLRTIVQAMKKAADQAGVEIVAGDTKVVPAGKADKIFINTTGIGVTEGDTTISGSMATPGDVVLISGSIGDHGVTILSSQQGLALSGDFRSDSAPLNGLTSKILKRAGQQVHVFRDPTRGGVATTLNEIAASSDVGIILKEEELPIRPQVAGACELLGLDPLYLANEGKLLAIVTAEAADRILEEMHNHQLGKEARIIGKVTKENPGRVALENGLGTQRLLDMLHGQPLPRIC